MSGTSVSIHAPVRGATYFRSLLLVTEGFNPRAREGRDIWSRDATHDSGFNPRAREGRDMVQIGRMPHIDSLFQSTRP